MWGTKTLDRARRRLRREPAGAPPTEPAADPAAIGDMVLALGRPDLDRFVHALATWLDPHMPRPDSPDRVAGALCTAIERLRGKGQPTVTRSPAGLYTPEYWHVRVAGADGTTREALRRLAAGERPA